ncbi:MAG: flagellar assembly protein FliW [Pirellulales bacterium]|nr:flagellar assembly protein FliW [Planctomycetales bacterium]
MSPAPVEMVVRTTRFGTLRVMRDDTITFAQGLYGLEDCAEWALLVDSQDATLGWLQSISRGEVALAVVSPRRFVPDYQIRASQADLKSLHLEDTNSAQVLVIVSKDEVGLSLNLKAPLVVNLEQRRGVQLVNSLDQPLQYRISGETSLKRIA